MYLYIQNIHCRVFDILYAYIFSSLFPNEQGRQTDQCHDTGSFFAPLQNSGHILAFGDQIYPKSQGFLSFIVFRPKNQGFSYSEVPCLTLTRSGTGDPKTSLAPFLMYSSSFSFYNFYFQINLCLLVDQIIKQMIFILTSRILQTKISNLFHHRFQEKEFKSWLITWIWNNKGKTVVSLFL